MTHLKLAPCPSSPNCVSSVATDEKHRIAPLHFEGSATDVWRAIESAVTASGGKIVASESGYRRAEFTSRVFGFIDDVEWVVDDAAKRIDFRSASRVGYYDFGANRRRLEKLARRLVNARAASIFLDSDSS